MVPEKGSPEKNPRIKNPQNNGPRKMVFQKFYLTHKNVTVIFASKYRRIVFIENMFVWVYLYRGFMEKQKNDTDGIGESRIKNPRKNGPLKNGPLEKNPRKNGPWKNGPRKMVFQKFYSTHKNVSVIFASKYRRILLIKNKFVVEFWVVIDYVTLT